jgi:glutathione S-transferase
VRIYGDRRSGNCLKVKLTADVLGIPYAWTEIAVLAGETRTPDFLVMNPAGQVPVVAFDDGRVLAQSNAIIRYLAAGSNLLPSDLFAQAKVDEWLFWEQYSHEPYVAVARYKVSYLGMAIADIDPTLLEKAYGALTHLEAHLNKDDWLANRAPSIADISLAAYTRLALEAGFDFGALPSVKNWLSRCDETFVPRSTNP